MDRACQVDRHDSEMGSWGNVRALPDPRLRPLVAGYTGYFSQTPDDTVRRHLPGLVVPLIFMFEPRFEVVACAGCGDALPVRHAFVAGLHDSFAITRSPGSEGGLQVDFTPLGARALCGLPMHLLAGRAYEAEEVFGREVLRLSEQLRDAPEWPSRFDAVDRFLLARLDSAHAIVPGIAWAYRSIVRSGGCVPISGLAARLEWDHRRLVSGFRDAVGLNPKTLARVVRFNRALEFARAGQSKSWAAIACESGYYDQAHMVREFSAFSGDSPTALAARFLPGGGVDG